MVGKIKYMTSVMVYVNIMNRIIFLKLLASQKNVYASIPAIYTNQKMYGITNSSMNGMTSSRTQCISKYRAGLYTLST